MLSRPLACYAVALGLSAIPVVATAQAPTCTYDRCSLRLAEGVSSPLPRVVQGVEARPVANVGLYAPHIPLLEQGPDSVQQPYLDFRTHVNRSGTLWLVGVATAASSIFFAEQAGEHHQFGGLVATIGLGTGISILGLVERARGVDALSEAMHRYNEALPDSR